MPRKDSKKRFSAIPPKAAATVSAVTEKPVVANPAAAPSRIATPVADVVTQHTAPEASTAPTVALAPSVPVEVTPAATEAIAPAVAQVVAPIIAVAAPVSVPSPATESLRSDLQSPFASTREAAAVELGRLGDRAAVPALCESLRDADADVAREAATALGLLGDTSALEPLASALGNADGFFHSVVRAAAASSLGQLRDPRAIPALLGGVDDSMAEASAEAIRALGNLGDPRAVDRLVEVVRDVQGFFLRFVRRAAVLALAQLGGEQAAIELHRVAADKNESFSIREAAQGALDATTAVSAGR